MHRGEAEYGHIAHHEAQKYWKNDPQLHKFAHAEVSSKLHDDGRVHTTARYHNGGPSFSGATCTCSQTLRNLRPSARKSWGYSDTFACWLIFGGWVRGGRHGRCLFILCGMMYVVSTLSTFASNPHARVLCTYFRALRSSIWGDDADSAESFKSATAFVHLRHNQRVKLYK